MKKISILIMVTVLMLSLVISQTSFPQAIDGNSYYGPEDKIVPDGYTLTAGIDGVIVSSYDLGEDESDTGFFRFGVPGKPGDTIEFFLNGEKMNEELDYISASSQDYLGITLTIDILPAGDEFCGDYVCSAETECSFCSVDCDFQDCIRDGSCDANIGETCFNSPDDCGLCLGNGVCDEGYGETCETAPIDCGSCETTKKKSSGGGGGGGGGGSSSAAAAGAIISSDPLITEEETEESPVPSLGDLNEQEEIQSNLEERKANKFTGMAVAVLGEGSTVGWLIILILILAVIWLYLKNKDGRKDKITPVTRSYAKKRTASKKKAAKKTVRKKR